MTTTRRGFLMRAAGFLAAPAIVRVGSIMPISVAASEVMLIHDPSLIERNVLFNYIVTRIYADVSLDDDDVVFRNGAPCRETITLTKRS